MSCCAPYSSSLDLLCLCHHLLVLSHALQFNLELEDLDIYKEDAKFWRAMAITESPPVMLVELLLDTSELAPNQMLMLVDESNRRKRVEIGPSSTATTPLGQGRSRRNIILESWSLAQRYGRSSVIGSPLTLPSHLLILSPSHPLTLSSHPLILSKCLIRLLPCHRVPLLTKKHKNLDSSNTPPNPAPEPPVVYKKSIIFFRSLYAYMRLLPAYQLYKRLRRQNLPLKIGFRVSRGQAPEESMFRDSDIGIGKVVCSL